MQTTRNCKTGLKSCDLFATLLFLKALALQADTSEVRVWSKWIKPLKKNLMICTNQLLKEILLTHRILKMEALNVFVRDKNFFFQRDFYM